MRHRIKACLRSCSWTLELMTEHSWNNVCKLVQSKTISITPTYGTCTADFMLRRMKSRAFLVKYLNDPRVPWGHKRREMMAIARIIPVATWLAKIKQRSDAGCRLCKRARKQRGLGTENLLKDIWSHHWTVPSAMEWQQPSRLPTISSRDIYMPACKLHKHQRVSSGLSYLYTESSLYTLWQEEKSLGRVWEEFEQRIADGPGKGSRNCKNDLCERARKETPWFRPENVESKLFLESEAG